MINYKIFRNDKKSRVNHTLVIRNNKNAPSLVTIAGEIYSCIINNTDKISEIDIFKHLHTAKYNISYNFTAELLQFISNIEMREIEGTKFYQKKNSNKTNANLIAYTVLSERGEKMYWKELEKEVKLRMYNVLENKSKGYKFTLKSNDHLKPIGRTGYWVLTEWNLNTDSQRELIRKIFLKFNRPATCKEIKNEVQHIRPEITEKSVQTILALYFIAISHATYILPEWKKRYPYLVFKQKKEKTD